MKLVRVANICSIREPICAVSMLHQQGRNFGLKSGGTMQFRRGEGGALGHQDET